MNTSEQSPLGIILDRVGLAAQRLESLASALNDHADRLYGCTPAQASTPSTVEPQLEGTYNQLQHQVEYLLITIDRVESAANRNVVV